MTLYKALFLFQYNVQNQNYVAQKRSSCHNNSCFCQRTFFGNGRRSCGNRAVYRRFHTGVFFADPPVAVFADDGGQTVLTVCSVLTVFAVFSVLAVLSVLSGIAFFAFVAVLTVLAVFAVLSGVTLIAFVAFMPREVQF